ncbi:MAG: outer membrane beta-barrel protein [Ignavibacteria bacterium]|nr:outer membrane beta-barrel protein [Ignavibacteria bacterium]
MKISIGIFLLSVLLTCQSSAQLKNFGIKGGLNLSNAELDYTSIYIKLDNKTGFNAYLTYDFLNFKNLTISGEAGYSQKGFNLDVIYTNEFGEIFDETTDYNRIDYIDINAIAQFILRNKSVSPYFSFGPVLSIYAGNNSDAGFDLLFQMIKSPVLGFIGGVGIEIDNVIPQTILAEVRYNFDLTNSFNNGFLNYQRNYLWQFNLGIKF